jgi:acyl transferase domain-containing protein
MAAVRLSREQAEAAVARHPGVEIAAVNSPQDVTVSGPAAQLGALRDELRKRRVFFWMMDLDYAFHCAATEPVRPGLEAELAGLAPAGPLDALVSTVSGGPATDLSGGLDGVHWWRNMRDPVLFAPAVDHALDRGITVLVEVGPQPALRPYLRRIIERRTPRPDDDQRNVDVVATLRREVEGAAVMNDALASLC